MIHPPVHLRVVMKVVDTVVRPPSARWTLRRVEDDPHPRGRANKWVNELTPTTTTTMIDSTRQQPHQAQLCRECRICPSLSINVFQIDPSRFDKNHIGQSPSDTIRNDNNDDSRRVLMVPPSCRVVLHRCVTLPCPPPPVAYSIYRCATDITRSLSPM